MKKPTLLVWVLLAAFLLFGSACNLTPRANMGLDVDYYGGSFHVRPSAEIGVYGRP